MSLSMTSHHSGEVDAICIALPFIFITLAMICVDRITTRFSLSRVGYIAVNTRSYVNQQVGTFVCENWLSADNS